MQKATLALAVTCALFCAGAALRCYIGDGDKATVEACMGACVKLEVFLGFKTIINKKKCSESRHTPSCHSNGKKLLTKLCFCSIDLCNGAPRAAAASWPLALTPLALALRAALL